MTYRNPMSRLRQRYAMAGANAVEQHGLPTECDRHVLIEHPLGQGIGIFSPTIGSTARWLASAPSLVLSTKPLCTARPGPGGMAIEIALDLHQTARVVRSRTGGE